MKLAITALAASVLISSAAHAQSVAQSIETLTTKVANLESRTIAGSPLVESTTQNYGGQLRMLDGQKQERVALKVDQDGGTFVINNKSGNMALMATVERTGAGGQWLAYNKNGQAVTVLGNPSQSDSIAGGLWILSGKVDANGKNQELAYFGGVQDGSAGFVRVNGTQVHDYAEVFDISDCHGLTPGSVVSESGDGKGIRLSGRAYDGAAVGVISGAGQFQPGMRIGSRADGSSDFPVAVAGQVYVWVNSESGAISVGDLLVSSSMPGVAMRGGDPGRLAGTVVGKALEPYGGGEKALIRMLVLNR